MMAVMEVDPEVVARGVEKAAAAMEEEKVAAARVVVMAVAKAAVTVAVAVAVAVMVGGVVCKRSRLRNVQTHSSSLARCPRCKSCRWRSPRRGTWCTSKLAARRGNPQCSDSDREC